MVSLDSVKSIIEGAKGKCSNFSFESTFLQTFKIPENKVLVEQEEVSNTSSDKSIFSINDIISLPDSIKDIVSDCDNYYLYGCYSYLDSILFSNILDYKLYSEEKKKKVQHDFKQELMTCVKEIYGRHKFAIKSSEITDKINSAEVDSSVLQFISHYLKRDIVVLNLLNNVYIEYSGYNNPIVLVKENDNIMCLINSISTPFSKEKLEGSSDWLESIELKKITKYKMPELIEIASKYNISLLHENGKKKIKAQLYQDILNKIN